MVGNSNYKFIPHLENPRHDTELVGRTLHDIGFELVGGKAQIDLNKAAFDKVVQSFGDEIQGAAVAFFYYAGHGVQIADANYLIPVSANPTNQSDANFQLVRAQDILDVMQDAGTPLNVMVLDACRNNPFPKDVRGANGGLAAQMQLPAGTVIAFATQPGNVALDGAGNDSPFTQALVKGIQERGVRILDVFNDIGLEVQQQTGGKQEPWTHYSPISGNPVFVH